jgi:CDP-glycerol glycerophosphotransferase (TagB/SpsB family)
MNELRVRIRVVLVRLGFAIGRWLPLQSRVVLATGHADVISGNLEWIRAELATRRHAGSVTVLAHAPSERPADLVRSAVDAFVAGYHLARARLFVVDDYFFPMYVVKKRPGTTFVQVWHACGAFKKFGYSVLEKGFGVDDAFVRRHPIHTNYDLSLVSAQRFAPFYAEAFRQPLERFTARLGIPRTDLFFDAERVAATSAALRQRYGLGAAGERRVVLYAPTFRGERITRARSPIDLDLAVLARALGRDHVLLVRAHPFVRARLELGRALAGFAIDVSDHPDINELMLVSDVLVTDYSSVMYEFALLERPMAFFAPDHAAYEAERGFYLDLARDLPGPIFETTDALAAYLAAGDFDLERVRRFRADSFDVADGRATARFVDELALPALG